ncbi:M56 family metallopeptidase [Myceligenerans halotolerans]
MTTALVLLAYAGALAAGGPRLMDRARWTRDAPRLGIITWLTLAASVASAVALAGIAIVMPMDGFHGGPAGIVAACVAALRSAYGPIAGPTLAVLAAMLTWLVPLLPVAAGAIQARRTAAERARLRAHLTPAAFDPAVGAYVVPAPRPAAYCLPGSGGTIVVTSGAIDLLDRPALDAVLAHERAHLAGHHHLLVAAARAARSVLGMLPLFAVLPDRIGQLVELAADDAASRTSGRRTLARSLLEVATARTTHAGALAAGGGDTAARIERLLQEPTHTSIVGFGTILGGNATAIAAPLLVTAIPILTTVSMVCCPI